MGSLRPLTQVVLFRLLLILALGCPALCTHAASRNWTGGVSANWSNPNNWTPVGVPLNGDVVDIPSSGSPYVTTNDLVDLRLDSIECSRFIDIRGNSLTISNGIQTGLNGHMKLEVLVFLGKSQAFTCSTPFADIELVGGLNLNGFNLNLPQVAEGDSITLGGTITGSGNLLVSPPAAMDSEVRLGAPGVSNTFAGMVTLTAGYLKLQGDEPLGTGGIVYAGGRLDLVNARSARPLIVSNTAALFTFGPCNWSGPIFMPTTGNYGADPVLQVTSSNRFVLSGPFNGSANATLELLAGEIEFAGTSVGTFSGNIFADNELLLLNKSGGARISAGRLFAAPYLSHEIRWLNDYQLQGIALDLPANSYVNLNNFSDDFGPINLYGGVISTGSGEANLKQAVTMHPSTQPAQINGVINLPGSAYPNNPFNVTNNDAGGGGLFVNASILGTGALIKRGPGILVLGGPTSYSGLTFVEEGILQSTSAFPLGTTAASTIVQDGATLWLNHNGLVNEEISLRGSGTGGTNGALKISGNVQLRNPFPSIDSCLDLTTNATIRVEPGGRLAADGFISGFGPLTKTGPGSLVFSNANANTYTGDTLVREGTLELRKPANTICVPGNLTLGPASASSPAVARWYQAGAVPANGIITVNAESLLDLNGNGQILSRLNLNGGGDAQTGAGTLSFAAGGIVAIDTLNPPGLGLRGSASITGNISLPDFDHVTFNVSRYSDTAIFTTTPELDVPANISGFGDIFKQGLGRLRFSGNNTFNDSPPFSTGNVQVSGGTLIAASPTALGGTGGVTFVDTAGTLAIDGGITITGEPLSLFSTNAPGLLSLTGANTWSGDIRFYRDSIVGVNASSSLLINGTIFGTGGLTKISPGPLTLGGQFNNTYSGDTFANEGTLVLDKIAISGVTTIPHHITVGTGITGNTATLLQHDATCIAGSVTVNNGGLWSLNASENFPDNELQGHDPLTLNGDAQVQMTSVGYLFLPPGGGITVNPGSNTTALIAGGVGLSTLIAGPTAHPIILNAGGQQSGSPECVISGNIEQVFGVFGLQKEGAGVLKLTGTNAYAGTNVVNGGTLWVDGLQPQSPVHLNTGTRLKGSGTVGHINLVGSSVAIAPGSSPGNLTCSNFNAGAAGSGTLEMEMNAFNPLGFDEIIARGTVNLTGLSLTPTLNFASSVGQNFTLIGNDGTDAVVGTFTGLPQNKKLYVGGELFQISYTGGTGNDVVLTRLVTPPRPTLTIERVSPASVRLMWATNDPPFSLQATTNLTTNWSTALPLPTVVGTNNLVTNTVSGAQKSYRLSNP